MKLNNNTNDFLKFISVSEDFKLGILPTEACHEKTTKLSYYANNDILKGVDSIKQLDIDLFNVLLSKASLIFQFGSDIYQTLENGNKIFLCGCGATGRLSLVLETLWLQQGGDRKLVTSFMAGGDIALIKSIEDFEDHPEFGERQLMELGFSDGDLLISCTEGGETPFVIGATQRASEVSCNNPYFLYCNPDDVLVANVQRSRKVIQNPMIKKINLFTGPMALSGSTRMQASTILMLAVGFALLKRNNSIEDVENEITALRDFVAGLDFSFLKEFVERESQIYKDDGYIFYSADSLLGISILTDTTERAPTFSLRPFENIQDEKGKHSWSYLVLPNEKNSKSAWETLLFRKPRALDWQKYQGRVNLDRLYGYDFSRHILHHRSHLDNHQFSITLQHGGIHFNLDGFEHVVSVGNLSMLGIHTVLKILLNIHSTLVMGRMERYHDNMMVWVRPSNYKLIDRSIRYINHFLMKDGINLTYEQIAEECASQMKNLGDDQSVVLNTLKVLRDKH